MSAEATLSDLSPSFSFARTDALVCLHSTLSSTVVVDNVSLCSCRPVAQHARFGAVADAIRTMFSAVSKLPDLHVWQCVHFIFMAEKRH